MKFRVITEDEGYRLQFQKKFLFFKWRDDVSYGWKTDLEGINKLVDRINSGEVYIDKEWGTIQYKGDGQIVSTFDSKESNPTIYKISP